MRGYYIERRGECGRGHSSATQYSLEAFTLHRSQKEKAFARTFVWLHHGIP